jgi:hypothetical protein
MADTRATIKFETVAHFAVWTQIMIETSTALFDAQVHENGTVTVIMNGGF